jgi:adenylate kinase family enzyme
MQRTLVLGSSGSGKSTFARQLGQLLQVQVIHLDSYFWQPNWVATPAQEWQQKLERLLRIDSWVMDGNYTASLDLRLSFADTVIFLDLNRLICLSRCIKRLLQNWGRNREELAPGCYEKMDWEFFQWIWSYPNAKRPGLLKRLEACAGNQRVFILRNNGEIADFLDKVTTCDKTSAQQEVRKPVDNGEPSATVSHQIERLQDLE